MLYLYIYMAFRYLVRSPNECRVIKLVGSALGRNEIFRKIPREWLKDRLLSAGKREERRGLKKIWKKREERIGR